LVDGFNDLVVGKVGDVLEEFSNGGVNLFFGEYGGWL